MSKRKSEKRQRTKVLGARVTPEEHKRGTERARTVSGSVGAFIRYHLLDEPLPRHATDAEILAKLLAVWQGFRGDFGHALSNLNQLTKYANLDRVLQASIAEATQEIMRGIDTLDELRLVTLQDMGYERNWKPPTADE